MARRSLLPFSSFSPAERGPELFLRLHREMDRLFEDVFRGFWPARGLASWEGDATPEIDVSETDDAIKICAELPGVDEKDVEVAIDGDVLTVRGEKKLERDEKKESFYLTERSHGRFARSIRLPYEIDPDKAEASLKNGVLTVTLQKPAESRQKTRRIEVKSGGGDVAIGMERAAAGSKPGAGEESQSG
jgi:HSP20 family protein